MANGFAKERFVGRTIPAVLTAFALAFAGVLVVDLYIEDRQIAASSHVAGSTIATLGRVIDFGHALNRFDDAAMYDRPERPGAAAALLVAESSLDEAMQDFEEHLSGNDRRTWLALRERMRTFEGSAPIQGNLTATEADQRVRAMHDDMSAITTIVGQRGVTALRSAQQLHTLEGALEATVLFFITAALASFLFGWRAQEARARARDAEVEEHLRRTVENLDAFAGRLAHDLRSPLTPILTGSQWIEHAPVTDAVRGQAERIERSARRLGRMIDALLLYTRASAHGPVEGAHTPVNVTVEETLAECDEAARARGARIETDLGPEAVLDCTPEIVQSIVANLVENALKYGAKEGERPRVTVRTRLEAGAHAGGEEGPFSVIEVEDAGPGIAPELRQQVFRPLFRGQKEGAGIGLGLSIVQRLVEAQRGSVELLSGKEGGALFRVRLPLGEESARERASATHGRAAPAEHPLGG